MLPLALVLLPNAGGLCWQTYTESLFETELVQFHYGQVGIRDLPSAVYAQSGNPIAATLVALMRTAPAEKATIKLAALRTVQASTITTGDKLFLANLIQVYLPLKERV